MHISHYKIAIKKTKNKTENKFQHNRSLISNIKMQSSPSFLKKKLSECFSSVNIFFHIKNEAK